MKKNPKLLEMMNKIDETYIEEAETANFLPQKNIWKRVGGIAASLALVATIGTFPLWGNLNQPEIGPEIPNGTTNETMNETGDFERRGEYVWDSKKGVFTLYTASGTAGYNTNQFQNPTNSNTEGNRRPSSNTAEATTTEGGYLAQNKAYPYLTGIYDGYTRARMGINKAYIGEWLGDIAMKGEDGSTIIASMYALKNIDLECAICIQYPEDAERDASNSYYVYYNPDVTFETFADFKKAYSLEEHLYIGDGVMLGYNFRTKTETLTQPKGSYLETVRYRVLHADGESCTYDEFLQACKTFESVGMDAFHGEMRCFDSGLQVFAEGYLMTNLGGSVHIFHIGKESAASIISAAKILEKEVGCFYFYDDERDILINTMNPDVSDKPSDTYFNNPAIGTDMDGTTGLTTPSYDPRKTTEAKSYMPVETVPETAIETEPLYDVNQPSYEGRDPYAWTIPEETDPYDWATTEETMVYETNPLIYEGYDPYAQKH